MENLQKNLVKVVKSRTFKTITIVLGLILFIITGFLAIDPTPFIKFGYIGVFIYCLFGLGTLIVPLLAASMNIYLLATVAALGNAFNDSVSYLIGKSAEDLISKHKRTPGIKKNIEKFGMYYLFLLSLIPFPYDFIGVIVGYLEYPYRKFLLATFLGKVVRFILIGWGISLIRV